MPQRDPDHNIWLPCRPHPLAARRTDPPNPPCFAALIAHGLFASMASAKLSALARALAGTGGLVLQFDHSGCGDSPGDIADTSLTGRQAEYLFAAEHLEKAAPGLPLVYLGSSMGGPVALLAGLLKPPAATVIWSAPLDFPPLAGRVGERPDLGALQADLANHDLEAAAATAANLLIVHGEDDEVVPVAQAWRAYSLAPGPKEILILPGADHRLSDLKDQKKATECTLAWIQRFIGGQRRQL